MKITVFGARGELGQLVINEALARGWDVVAFVQSRSAIRISSNRLRVVSGSLEDEATMEKAVKGSKAVISLLIPVGTSRRMPVSTAVARVVAAMQKNKVNRLVCLGTVSVKDPNDRFSLPFALAVFMRKASLPFSYADAVRIGAAVRESGLAWTIVRIASLTNRQQTGEMRVGFVGRGDARYAAASTGGLARLLIDQVEDDRFLEAAPVVSD